MSEFKKLKKLNAEERIHNYNEVVLGMSEEEALAEANRCLNCVNKPCVNGCPINNRIPEFIQEIKNKNYTEAYKIILSKSSFPAVCSRVCNTEAQCQSKCTRGIKGEAICIHGLERFVCDQEIQIDLEKLSDKNKKVAVIGCGPSGLACAKQLALKGYAVTIFEASSVEGGILTYGIPEFRLPKRIVKNELEKVKKLGVNIQTNTKITDFCGLKAEFDAVYIAVGTGASKYMNIEGEALNGVFVGADFLNKANLDTENFSLYIRDKKVAVMGGGNVAMDVARSAIRLGAKSVDIVYRRSAQEMPASKDEIDQTMQEGVNFVYLQTPIKIQGNGKVESVKYIKMQLGEPDDSGRRRPIEIKDSEFEEDIDVVVMAISTYPEDIISKQNIELDKYNCIVTDEYGKTSVEGIFAGGDIVTGPLTVVHAVNAARIAADAIEEYLEKE